MRQDNDVTNDVLVTASSHTCVRVCSWWQSDRAHNEKKGKVLRRKTEQPQNGYNNDMRNIHSAIIIFMARGRIPLARYNELRNLLI